MKIHLVQRLLQLHRESLERSLTPAEAMELLHLAVQMAASAPGLSAGGELDADAVLRKVGEGLGAPEPLTVPEPTASAARFRNAHAEAVARDAEALRLALRVLASAVGAVARGGL